MGSDSLNKDFLEEQLRKVEKKVAIWEMVRDNLRIALKMDVKRKHDNECLCPDCRYEG